MMPHNIILFLIVVTVFVIVRTTISTTTTSSSSCSFLFAVDAWTISSRMISNSNNIKRRRTATLTKTTPSSSMMLLRHYSLSSSSSSSSSSLPATTRVEEQETTTTATTNRLEGGENTSGAFFIRPARMNDMEKGSKILADGFFFDTNFFKYNWEKYITYLSLEANFPNSIQARSRYEIYVACCLQTDEVLGMVEIDARERKRRSSSNLFQQSGGSPYMCNLAVDMRHQRKGIATSLVYECERQVQEWYNKYNNNNDIINNDDDDDDDENKNRNKENDTTSISNSVCLKVRESNMAAIQMYLKLGYLTVWQEKEDNGNTILVMRKQLSSSSSSSAAAAAAAADITTTTNNNNTVRVVVS